MSTSLFKLKSCNFEEINSSISTFIYTIFTLSADSVCRLQYWFVCVPPWNSAFRWTGDFSIKFCGLLVGWFRSPYIVYCFHACNLRSQPALSLNIAHLHICTSGVKHVCSSLLEEISHTWGQLIHPLLFNQNNKRIGEGKLSRFPSLGV